MASAQDIIQSAKFLQSQAYVDPDRLLLVGVSAGGFGSLASASLSPRGLAGVINFAGGRGSGSSDSVCREDPLIAAAGLYGKTVRVPTLWVYAENDHFFGPQLARAMFGAFTAAGAPGELIIAPPFGNDGHGLFSSAGIPRWRDLVDDFLRKHHLPTWAQPVTIPIPDLPAPSDASTDAVKEFKRYLASQNYEKAFVFGAEGRFTWVSGRRTAEGAVADALKGCERAGVTCRPYAINDTLMEPVRQSVSVKAAFEKYNLLGMFAWDCAKPASKNNLYYINRALDADHVQRDQMSGTTTRDFVIFIDKAVEVKPNEIAVSGTREGKPQEILWRIERKPGGDGMRVQGVEASWGGKKLIAGGKVPDTGREAPWLNRCGG